MKKIIDFMQYKSIMKLGDIVQYKSVASKGKESNCLKEKRWVDLSLGNRKISQSNYEWIKVRLKKWINFVKLKELAGQSLFEI